jgi:hypothetical protein
MFENPVIQRWSLTLREEQRLTESEKMVLRRIFGSMRDDITERWRKMYN